MGKQILRDFLGISQAIVKVLQGVNNVIFSVIMASLHHITFRTLGKDKQIFRTGRLNQTGIVVTKWKSFICNIHNSSTKIL